MYLKEWNEPNVFSAWVYYLLRVSVTGTPRGDRRDTFCFHLSMLRLFKLFFTVFFFLLSCVLMLVLHMPKWKMSVMIKKKKKKRHLKELFFACSNSLHTFICGKINKRAHSKASHLKLKRPLRSQNWRQPLLI